MAGLRRVFPLPLDRGASDARQLPSAMKSIVCLLVLLVSSPAFATTYYVNSATGDDSNPGTEAAPFKTFGHVAGLTLNPGDTVCFARGTTYPEYYFEFTQSGTAAQPITITSYGSGSLPVFSNSLTDQGQHTYYVVRLTGSNIVLNAIATTDCTEAGIFIMGNNNVVENCEAYNTGYGICITGQNSRVTSNYIHDLHMVQNTPGGDDDYGAIGINIANGTNGADIGWNRIERCIAQSDDYGYDGGAFEFYGNISNVQVHHNICDGNNGVFEVGGGAISNVVIYYNQMNDNGVFGGFHFTGKFAATVSNFRIENNTVVDTASDPTYDMFWFDASPGSGAISVTNNIFHYQGFSHFATGDWFTHQYNLYYSPDGTPLNITPGSTEIVADPKFVNLGAANFQLQSSSPAINAGTNLGYTYDRLANPIVNTPDLGAFESPY